MKTPIDVPTLIADTRQRIAEMTPAAALARQSEGATLIDVRDDHERATGMPTGAAGVSRGFLELRIAKLVPDAEHEVLVMCGSGMRSLLAADTLRRMGYTHVASVAGGFARWKAEGLPVDATE
ncbi:MAG TPA: rhodanese-like domain-containing protein [Rhodanobacteraceae bacterium]